MTEQDKVVTASEPMPEAGIDRMKAVAEDFLGPKPVSQVDKALKIVEFHNEVFADIVNVGLFNGRQVLHAEELQNHPARSQYSKNGVIHELERDIIKRWKTGDIRLACIGLENQVASDPDMPLRVMGYDSADYNLQVHSKDKKRYPVVTLVLYFGNNKPWNGPLSLKERVDIPEELDPYVSDYKINLFQVSYLSREQADFFRSDFRVIADYFVQKRETGDYHPKPMDIAHMQDTLQLMRAITKDDRYVEVYESCTDEEKGGIRNMCDVLVLGCKNTPHSFVSRKRELKGCSD